MPNVRKSKPMNPAKMRNVDIWIGKPICAFLTLLYSIVKLFFDKPNKYIPRKILFIKLTEQGATVLGYASIIRAIEMVGAENVYFLVFNENREILEIINVIPKEYSKVIQYSMENKKYILDSEMRILGLTHTVVGELLAEKWNLPKQIKNAIRYHNTGFVNGSFNHLVSSVHIANIAANAFCLGNKWEYIIPTPNINVWNYLNLDKNFFKDNIKKILNDFEESVILLLKN